MIPERAIEDCDACAKGGGLMYSTCRSCVARYLSRLMLPARIRWYAAAAKVHTEDCVTAFKREVADWSNRLRREGK
jgi:hypothetical protein